MPMIDLGHEYPTDTLEAAKPESKPRRDYPTIYLRGDQVPDKLPEGKFFTLMEVRVAGMRNPSDGEKSLDLEALRMTPPVDEEHAKAMLADTYDEDDDSFSEEKSTSAFRDTMKQVIKDSQIGQSV